jgi:hypothetical protein
MTILPMSIFEKIRWFIIEPTIDFLFPKSPEEIEKEKQEAMIKLMKKGFHFNRKQDGEEIGRP